MKFLKLSEIHLTDDNVINKGHVAVNLSEIRKIIKIRDSLGTHCSKISFSGLSSSEDIHVRETPDIMAAMLQGEGTALKDKFEPTKQLVSRQTVAEVPPAPPIEFVTQISDKV